MTTTKDKKVPCLEIREMKSGKFYYIRKTDAFGVQRRISLGAVGELPLQAAREKAQLYAATLSAGKNPKKALKELPRVNDLYQQWLKEHAPELKEKTRSDMILLWDKYILPVFADRTVISIEREDIVELRDSIISKSTANKVLAVLSKAFNLAELWRMREQNTNPCVHVKKYAEKKRVAYLADHDFRNLMLSCKDLIEDGSPYHQISAKALLCLMLTGARKGEIISAKWEYYNEALGCLHLPDSKTGEKTISLPREVCHIINSIEREGDYIFASTTKANTHIDDLKHTWARVKKDSAIPQETRIHDLRHNFAARLASKGVGIHQIGELLGHSQIETTKRYAHFMHQDKISTASKVLEGVM